MGFGYKGFFVENGWLKEKMDKGLTVPKWVLINWLKIPQMPQNLSVQIVCPNPKVWCFDGKRLKVLKTCFPLNFKLEISKEGYPI